MKRGSTHSTLSVAHSLSNLSNSPTPTMPTTPMVDGSTPPPSRPSSSRRTPRSDDMLSVKGDRSQSQSPLGHTSVGNAVMDSPTGINFSAGECKYQFAECDSGYTEIRGSPVQYAKPARLSFCILSPRRYTHRGVNLKNDRLHS